MSGTVTETPETETPTTVTEGQATEVTTPSETVEAPPSEPPVKPWVNRRIDDLTRQRYDAQRRADQAEAEAARLRQELQSRGARPPKTQTEPQATPPDQSETLDSRSIEQRAQELVKVREFNERCNKVYRSGKTEHADFDQVLEGFNNLGGLQPHVVEAVIEADEENAHKILYDLGKDPDAAYTLLNETNPFRLAKRVLELSQKHKPKPTAAPVSKAPAPPSGGVRAAAPSVPEADPEKMSMTQWVEWRNKTKKVR